MAVNASRLVGALQGWAERVAADAAQTTADAITAEQWIVGHPTQPFDPHQRLAGTAVEERTDEQLANPASFPPTPFFFPGDHKGCLCRLAPLPIQVQAQGLRAHLSARVVSPTPAVGRVRGGGLAVAIPSAQHGVPRWWPDALRREWPQALRQAAARTRL